MPVPSSGPQRTGRMHARHAWQGHEPFSSNLLPFFYQHRLKLLWAGLLCAAFILFVWMDWLLLFAPKRTPLVVLSAAPYTWPLPPNAWATEDVDKLAALDGQNISIRGVDEPVLTRDGFLNQLEKEIDLSHTIPTHLPLIIYMSLHGVGEGIAEDIGERSQEAEAATTPAPSGIHLILPQSSPTDSASWIHVDELATRLSRIDPQRKTLLILDCQRMQVNWNIGLLENQFAEQLQQAYVGQFSDNLAILLSAGPREHAHVADDLRGSVFGHYLRQGLAGAADVDAPNGDGDGWVSLIELHAFLQSHVSKWTQQNRGASQTPQLLVHSSTPDFRLTKAYSRNQVTLLLEGDRKTARPEPHIPANRLDKLWRQLDELRELRLYQNEPVAWRNLEHHLLWLEQLSTSGSGYRSLALRTLDDAEKWLESIQSNLDRVRQSHSIQDRFSVISGDPWPLPNGLRMHSTALAEYFGTQQATAARELEAALAPFGEQPGPAMLSAMLPNLPPGSTEFASGHFLRMLGRYQFPRMWEPPQSIGQLLKLQTALRNVAVPRDAAGLPADERVHAWLRPLVSRAQMMCRQAEDRLFVQGENSLEQQLSQTEASFLDAMDAQRSLQVSLAACDRAMAETPYLAQWLTHPLHVKQPVTTQETVNSRLLPLIDRTQQLAAELASCPSGSPEPASVTSSIARIETLARDTVSEPFDSLTEFWNAACQQLLLDSESDDPELVGELQAVLSVPLVAWEIRRDLRAAANRLTARLYENFDDLRPDTSRADGLDSDPPSNRAASSLKPWSRHPLLAILGQSPSNNSRSNPIISMLSEVDSVLDRQASATSLAEQRAICSQAARRLRFAAPMWFAMPRRDPLLELRQLDMQSLLIWHAQSALDDFWGPAGMGRAFFDLAASDYLDAAIAFRQLSPAVETQPVSPEIANLQNRLTISQQAVPTWMTTRVADSLQLSPDDPIETSVSVVAELADGDGDQPGFSPPSGSATVFVREREGRLTSSSIEPSGAVELPANGQQRTVILPADTARVHADLQAVTMFRGHEYAGTIGVEELGGITIDLKPYRYDFSEITLNSPWQKLSVVFILDCSHSMQDPLVAGGEADGARSRMDIAKLALQELLFNLSLRRNVRIGVQLFGHRLGWSTDAPVRPVTRPDLTSLVAGVSPSEDVESILPLGNFDLAAAQSVIPRINSVEPWGQSPLYLSIVEALNDFGSDDVDADRHIIVITDGANYQYIPPSETDVQATSGDDVRQAWSQNQVPIHVLGLGMDRTQDQVAIREFEQLCTDTGGRFQALTDSIDLTQALSMLLGPGTYRLNSADALDTIDRESLLGSPIRLSPPPSTNQPFWLSYEGRGLVDPQARAMRETEIAAEEVWLEGGESMQLFVSEQGDAIHAYPYQANVAAVGELITSQREPTDYVARIHRPSRDSLGQVTIPISWQRKDTRAPFSQSLWRVTRRPPEVWVEVQPLSADDEPIGLTYAFFDTNFEPDQPVPLMKFMASRWPAAAVKACIQLWCQPPSTPQSTSDLQLVPSQGPLPAKSTQAGFPLSFPVDDALKMGANIISGASLRLEQPNSPTENQSLQQRFVVEFTDESLPVTSLKLRIPNDEGVQPTRIVRQFDAQHRIAVHTFYFDEARAELPTTIEVTNRAYEIDRAWQLQPDTHVVELSAPGNFLPVTSQ